MQMTEATSWEQEQARARETAEEIVHSSYTNPIQVHENPWGMFSWGDAPPAIGGGIGAFQWFASREILINFISDHAVLMWKEFEEKDEYEKISRSLRQAANKLGEDDESLDQFNQNIRGLFQVEWIGTFNELTSSDGQFSSKVRANFNELEGDQASSAPPIEQKDLARFSESLEEYGL